MQKTFQILIVDDEKDVRDCVKIALEMEGFRVFTACNGKEALEYLQSNPLPSLILLDLTMPVMNGAEFLQYKNTLEHLVHIPTVVFSGELKEPVALAFPAEGYLAKPSHIDDLLRTVHKFCG